jgi:hypothetical protein
MMSDEWKKGNSGLNKTVRFKQESAPYSVIEDRMRVGNSSLFIHHSSLIIHH